MNLLKSIYISVFVASCVGLTLVAFMQWLQAPVLASPWLGALLAAAAPAGFFIGLYLRPRARTRPLLWGVLGLALLGSGLAAALGGGLPLWLALLVGVLGTVIYDLWYSRFPGSGGKCLQPGQCLPEFKLRDLNGAWIASRDLLAGPVLWLFYRGNWCPFCVAQIQELSSIQADLQQRCARVILVSPQSADKTRALAGQFDPSMRFLIDEGNQTANRLGIGLRQGLPAGLQILGYDSDVPLPTTFLTAPGGEIVFAKITHNYRLRPDPEVYLRALDAMPSRRNA